MKTTNIYNINEAIPLHGEEYIEYLNGTLFNAKKRIWVAMFIINPRVDDDRGKQIRSLIKSLYYAQWRNVDVRIIIGRSLAEGISIANNTALNYINYLKIPIRTFAGKYRRSLHSKYVIIDDDEVVVGSHNWTPGAATRLNEESVVVRSKDLNIKLRDEFLSLWNRADKNEK